jgi:hypothetical protein
VILAIDPGTTESAYVATVDGRMIEHGKLGNDAMLDRLCELSRLRHVHGRAQLVVEMIASYGMPVGREVFETVRWIGRFEERWLTVTCGEAPFATLYRSTVKLHLCGQTRAKDANVRQALIDRFGPGKEKAIGTKAKPGPLYGIKADVWQALALAVTFADAGGKQ